MKRTLSFLVLAIAGSGLAQTPATAGKPAPVTPKVAVASVKPTPGKPKPAAATQKPVVAPQVKAQPATVRVVPVNKPGTTAAAKPAAKPATKTPVAVAKPAASAPKSAAAKPVPAKKALAAAKSTAGKANPQVKPAAVVVATSGPKVKPTPAAQDGKDKSAEKKPARVLNAANRRDPFTSPVVSMGPTGSGCSTGKRCLAIDQIALRGVVKSDSGMIAVVVNAMDKAYFLRENDPVFNGYVVKITGDSVIFKETFHDRLGKVLTRDVTKSISRPAA